MIQDEHILLQHIFLEKKRRIETVVSFDDTKPRDCSTPYFENSTEDDFETSIWSFVIL